MKTITPILPLIIIVIMLSCSYSNNHNIHSVYDNKLSPENSYEDRGFGWSISANESYLLATSYDNDTYLFNKKDTLWEEDPTVINSGYTLNTDMSDKYIAVSYLSSSAKTLIKVLQNVDGSWQEDLFLKSTGSIYEKLGGNISISNRHFAFGFTPPCRVFSDKSGIFIYTRKSNGWKKTAKIESDSYKDFDLTPITVTENYAFLTYNDSNSSDFVRILSYKDCRWRQICDLGPFNYVDLVDANEKYLVIESFEGDSVKTESEVFIYELFNDSISKDPIILKEFNDEVQDLKLYKDKLIISVMAPQYFYDEWGCTSDVTLYQIRGKDCFKVEQFQSHSKDLRRFLHTGDWNSEGFGFSVNLNSEYVFIGAPKDDIHETNQGSVNVLRY